MLCNSQQVYVSIWDKTIYLNIMHVVKIILFGTLFHSKSSHIVAEDTTLPTKVISYCLRETI